MIVPPRPPNTRYNQRKKAATKANPKHDGDVQPVRTQQPQASMEQIDKLTGASMNKKV